jgi:hypothetical protein
MPPSAYNNNNNNNAVFPRELEAEIFELAALLRPAQVPVLMRVASRVKFW